MISKAKDVLKGQKKNLAALAFGAIFLILGISYLTFNDSSISHLASSSQKAVALPVDKINAQEMWMTQVDSQNKTLEAQNKLLDQKFKYLESLILDQKKKEEEGEKEKQELKKEINKLKSELKNVSEKAEQIVQQETASRQNVIVSAGLEQMPANQTAYNLTMPSSQTSSFSHFDDPFATKQQTLNLAESDVEVSKPSLVEAIMSLDDRQTKKKTAYVDEKIFAGTTVKALLVSSVDAVCGVFSNSDPIPVKLRVLDNGHLPKHVEAKLKGGLIIGSAFGNLSSERVYIRLERMSLIHPNGEGIEMEVAGYVSGEDGRFGLRGLVVDRSTKIIKNAAYSGFLSGTGQILQSAVNKRPVVDSWNSYAVGTDILKQGCTSGAGNAFDMLADYYIRRAEQVQPVLQVNAGRIVDVTFTYGSSLGDLNVKDKIKETRMRNRSGS